MAKTGFEKPDMAADERRHWEPKVGKKAEIWLRIIFIAARDDRAGRWRRDWSRQQAEVSSFKDWVTGSGVYGGGDDQRGERYREEPEEKKCVGRQGGRLFVGHFFSFMGD